MRAQKREVTGSVQATALAMAVALISCGSVAHTTPASPNAGPFILVSADDVPTGVVEFTALDWDGGNNQGGFGPIRVCPEHGAGSCVQPIYAPDGTRALLGDVIVDATGATVQAVATSTGSGYHYGLGMLRWADDSRHLCAVGSPMYSSPASAPGGPSIVGPWVGAPNALYLVAADGSGRQVTTFPVGGTNDITTVLSCSLSADASLTLTQILPGGTDAVLRLSSLSSGTTLAERKLTLARDDVSTAASDLVASTDGTRLARTQADYTRQSQVTDVAHGDALGGPIPGRIHLFSADGARMLVSSPQGVSLLAVADHRVIWHSDQPFCGAVARPTPGSAQVAVCVGSGGSAGVWLVGTDGSARHLADGGLASADAGP